MTQGLELIGPFARLCAAVHLGERFSAGDACLPSSCEIRSNRGVALRKRLVPLLLEFDAFCDGHGDRRLVITDHRTGMFLFRNPKHADYVRHDDRLLLLISSGIVADSNHGKQFPRKFRKLTLFS
jgi:hypothetical protein